MCKEFHMVPYIPHQHTDPEKHPDITPRQVTKKDKKQVTQSSLVIAYVGRPSIGVGFELAIAEENKIPVILLYEKGKQISRIGLGRPKESRKIAFTDFDDALKQLRRLFQRDYFWIHLAKEKPPKQKVFRLH